MGSRLLSKDRQLVQIVDAALAEAARKSGPWLACRPGCTQCCLDPFPISQLDALRLQRGLTALEKSDPARAKRVKHRARDFVRRFSATFPGDSRTGILDETEEAEAKFADFANDEPCPALDPKTGLCDLYSARPITCRTFGPPVRSGPEGFRRLRALLSRSNGRRNRSLRNETGPRKSGRETYSGSRKNNSHSRTNHRGFLPDEIERLKSVAGLR